jgi:hypothetical protein
MKAAAAFFAAGFPLVFALHSFCAVLKERRLAKMVSRGA